MTREGAQFADVLAEAQARGLAEADPSFDVDGIDSAHKLVILTALAFGAEVRLDGHPDRGHPPRRARSTSRFARELGYAIKLLAIAKRTASGVEARVHPTMVPATHLLADVSGAFNAIFVDGEALGSSMYYGLGAGMMPTATAVVADLIEVARNRLHRHRGARAAARLPPQPARALGSDGRAQDGVLSALHGPRPPGRARHASLASSGGIEISIAP